MNDIRVAYLGKKGPITEVLRGMGKLSAEERPKMGALANDVRETITAHIEEKQAVLEEEAVNAQLATETIDVTFQEDRLIEEISPVNKNYRRN